MTYAKLLAEGGAPPDILRMLVPMLMLFAIFYFIALRPRRKEQKHRESMLGNMKKYDRVMTIGGIFGTIMEVRENEVILKVDDSTNTRMKFSRGAIQRVVTEDETTAK